MPINNGQFNAYANYPGVQGVATNTQMSGAPMQMGQTMQNQQYGYSQGSGLSIAQIQDDSAVNSYPVAAGNTVLLINFNSQHFFLKSTNVNGVPMPVQTAEWSYVNVQPIAQQNQNGGSSVTREEFDELKAMLAQALTSRQNDRQGNSRYQKRGGGQNVQSSDDSAANG